MIISRIKIKTDIIINTKNIIAVSGFIISINKEEYDTF